VAKLFKVNSVNSDGTDVSPDKVIDYLVIDPSTSKPYIGEDGKPSVIITLRPISNEKYREVVNACTDRLLNRKNRQYEQVTDWDKVQDELVAYSIVSWVGIIGADDKPLQCVLDAKLGIPGELKNEMVARAMQGETVDAAASFRPAP
jgi:hypothetical protein